MNFSEMRQNTSVLSHLSFSLTSKGRTLNMTLGYLPSLAYFRSFTFCPYLFPFPHIPTLSLLF